LLDEVGSRSSGVSVASLSGEASAQVRIEVAADRLPPAGPERESVLKWLASVRSTEPNASAERHAAIADEVS
jgi:hypothetical protein